MNRRSSRTKEVSHRALSLCCALRLLLVSFHCVIIYGKQSRFSKRLPNREETGCPAETRVKCQPDFPFNLETIPRGQTEG